LFEHGVFYELMCKNVVQPDRPQMKLWPRAMHTWYVMLQKYTLR